jgi:glycosyltransferase involved in cell wall biosynthesis
MERHIDIICFSISRSDAPISSPGFSLAKEFSKSHRVFYIDHPYSWKDLFTEWNTPAVKERRKHWFGKSSPFKTYSSNLTIVTTPLTLPINFLPEGNLYKRLFAFNDKLIFDMIRRLKKQFLIKDFIFINFFDPFFCRVFPSDIQPWKCVYQSMDAISEVAYTARHGIRLENEIIQKADITICTSTGLLELHKKKSPNVFLLPNGVDQAIFSVDDKKIPGDLQGISKPVIGYIGSIEYRMDFELLQAVVQSLPSYQFCFIGPVYEKGSSIDELRRRNNVHFLGSRPQSELPSYLRNFDAVIIPFKCNNLTSKIYPLKVNEYLMAGRPVVSTDFSPDISSFVPQVYIAKTPEEFAQQLIRAVKEDDDEKAGSRIDIARQNTWEVRARQFIDILMAPN